MEEMEETEPMATACPVTPVCSCTTVETVEEVVLAETSTSVPAVLPISWYRARRHFLPAVELEELAARLTVLGLLALLDPTVAPGQRHPPVRSKVGPAVEALR